MSLLQNGPLPCFIHETDMDAIINGDGNEAQRQFGDGLEEMRIVQVEF